MKTKTKAMILAGLFAMTATFPVTALARRGGASSGKGMQGQTQKNNSQARQQLRVQDGSCVNYTGAVSKRQNRTDRGKKVDNSRLQDGSCILPVE